MQRSASKAAGRYPDAGGVARLGGTPERIVDVAEAILVGIKLGRQ